MQQLDSFDQAFLSNLFENESKRFNIIILKVASSCNLDCKYCYWFRDQSVYELPGVMKPILIDNIIERIKEYLKTYDGSFLKIIFHGGEPLLLKQRVFAYICEALTKINPKVKMQFGVTTNGVLINDEWSTLFKKFRVGVTVSIDGQKADHDKNRIDLKGQPTYEKVRAGISCLQRNKVPGVSLLSVFTPGLSASELCDHFVNDIGVKIFDVLIPDWNHDDKKSGLLAGIAEFYIELFDVWLDKYWSQGVRIRSLESFVKAICFNRTRLPGVGICPVKIICINSLGEIETYDAFRVNGKEHVQTNLNISHSPLSEILANKLWLKHLKNSLSLPKDCQTCEIKSFCRGGNVIHRYSQDNGYDNPSVYCNDLKKMYGYILAQKNKLRSIGMCISRS